jgi:hypothetical protein
MAAKNTGWAQLKIGLVAIFALVLLALLIVLMSGTNPLFQTSTDIYVYFDDSFAMTPGATPVRLNGILVGKVGNIDLSGSDAVDRAVRITLSVDTKSLNLIPDDSVASLASSNLLGGRFVNIKRGRSAQAVQAGGEIKAAPTTDIEDMLEQGKSTLSALQTILEPELNARFSMLLLNYDEDRVGELLRQPESLIALSDAGAHASILCDAGYATHLLGHWVRERGVFSVEEAVRRLTSMPAEVYGIAERGRLVEGAAADVTCFDPGRVAMRAAERVRDLPGGAERVVTKSDGVVNVFVAGAALLAHGTWTGRQGGRVLGHESS